MKWLVLVGILVMPGVAGAQSDNSLAMFKADAAPYIRLSKLADAATHCGLRSSDWNLDAQSAINDKFTYFADNIWFDANDPDSSKALNDAEEAATLAQEDGENFSAAQCANLAQSDDMPIMDVLILTDPNITDAQQVVPGDIPANQGGQ